MCLDWHLDFASTVFEHLPTFHRRGQSSRYDLRRWTLIILLLLWVLSLLLKNCQHYLKSGLDITNLDEPPKHEIKRTTMRRVRDGDSAEVMRMKTLCPTNVIITLLSTSPAKRFSHAWSCADQPLSFAMKITCKKPLKGELFLSTYRRNKLITLDLCMKKKSSTRTTKHYTKKLSRYRRKASYHQ